MPECNASALSTSAACLGGLSGRELLQIQVFLLATKAGVAVDANALATSAACLGGLSEKQLKQVSAMLLCTILNL